MAAFTLATAAAVLTIGKTLSSFASQQKGATAATRQADYEATLLDRNAELADQQAADALARGDTAVSIQQAQVRGLIGSQRAAAAASGVDVGSGSALDVQLDTAGVGELDRTQIKNNAMLESWGFKSQASDLRARANLVRYAGKNTAAGLKSSSYSTLLSGASELASQYQKR
jgi:hypothetical protein